MTQLMTNYWVRNSSLDLCIIVKSGTAEDGEEEGVERKRNYFVRGLINIPTLASASSVAKGEKSEAEGEDEGLTWGVWVRVNEETFKWIVTNWDKEGRESDERAKGLSGEIATRLPTYTKDTLGTKVQIKIQPVGRRPTLVVQDSHPLAAQQKNGITRKKLLQTVLAIQNAVA